jgi:hypothetical protein
MAHQLVGMDRIANYEFVSSAKSLAIEANLQSVFEILVNFHNGSLITTSITIVGGYNR